MDAPTLDDLWQRARAERSDAAQSALLCGAVADYVTSCQLGSEVFQGVFGDGTELMSVVCRLFDRVCRDAIRGGFPGAFEAARQLLASRAHMKLLMLLSSLVDPSAYRGRRQLAAYEAVIRVAALHNMAALLCQLHEAYLEVVEHTAIFGTGGEAVSPDVVAAEQRQLTTLSALVSSECPQSRQLLSDMFTARRVQAVFRTFRTHLHYPHWASTSVAALAQDLFTQIVKHGKAHLTRATLAGAADTLVGAFRFNFEEAAAADDAAIATQRLHVLAHLLDVLRALLSLDASPSTAHDSDFDDLSDLLDAVDPARLEYNAIVNVLLLLQDAMGDNARLRDRVVGHFFAFAELVARDVTHAAPEARAAAAAPARSGFARLFTGVKAIVKSGADVVVSNVTGHRDPKGDGLDAAGDGAAPIRVTAPAVLEAACSFTICCINPRARLAVGERLLQLVGDPARASMAPALRTTMLVKLLENLRNFDAALQVSISCAFSTLSQTTAFPVHEQLPALISVMHARSLTYDGAGSIISLLSLIAAGVNREAQPGLAKLVMKFGTAKVAISIVDFLSGSGDAEPRFATPAGTPPDLTARHNATLLALLLELWRALIGVEIATDGSTVADDADVAALLECAGRRSRGAHVAREMLSALVALHPATIGPLIDTLSAAAAGTADGKWPRRVSDLMLTVVHVLAHAPECSLEFARRNGVQLVLTLLYHAERSAAPHFDLNLISVMLSMTLPHVRYCAALNSALAGSIAPTMVRTVPAAQLLVDLTAVQLVSPAVGGTRHVKRWMTSVLSAMAADGSDAELPASPLARPALPLLVTPTITSSDDDDDDDDVEDISLHSACRRVGPYRVAAVAAGSPLFCPLPVPLALLCQWFAAATESAAAKRAPGGGGAEALTPFERALPDLGNVICDLAAGFQRVHDVEFTSLVLQRRLPLSSLTFTGALTDDLVRGVMLRPRGQALTFIAGLLRTSTTALVMPQWLSLGDGAAAGFIAGGAKGSSGGGLTVACWLRWRTAAAAKRQRINVWTATVGGAKGPRTMLLTVDPALEVTLLRTVAANGSELEYILPFLPAQRWTHVTLSYTRGVSTSRIRSATTDRFTMYIDGVAAKEILTQPVGDDDDASGDTDLVLGGALPVGSPVIRDFGAVHVVRGAIGAGAAARLFAQPNHSPPTHDAPHGAIAAVGTDAEWLTGAEFMGLQHLCLVGCCAVVAGPIDRWDSFAATDAIDDADMAVALHPAATLRTPSAAMPYLDNMDMALSNLLRAADTDDAGFRLSGTYSVAGVRVSDLAHQLVSCDAVATLLEWLRAAVVEGEEEEVATLLRILSTVARRVNFGVVRGRAFWDHIAASLSVAGPRILNDDMAVRELLFMAIQPPRTNVPASDTAHSVLVNVALAEKLLLNWRTLSHLRGSATLRIVRAVRGMLSPANEFAQLNAARLVQAQIVSHYTFGAARHHVDHAILVESMRCLEDLLPLLPDPEPAVADVLAFVLASLPRDADDDPAAAIAARLSTAMPVDPYVTAVRHVVLLALVQAVETSDNTAEPDASLSAVVASLCPPWWIVACCGPRVHPVTVALALRLLRRLVPHAGFRRRCDAQALGTCLERVLLTHAHQHDVLAAVGCLALGTDDVFSERPAHVVAGFHPTAANAPFMSPLMHMLKAVALSVSDAAGARSEGLRHEPVTVALYLSTLSAAAKVRSSRFRVAALAVLACCRLRRQAAEAPPAVDDEDVVVVTTVPLPATCVLTKDEVDRRVGLVVSMLGAVSSRAATHTAVVDALLPAGATVTSPIDALAWILLCNAPSIPAAGMESALVTAATRDDCYIVDTEDAADDDDDEWGSAKPLTATWDMELDQAAAETAVQLRCEILSDTAAHFFTMFAKALSESQGATTSAVSGTASIKTTAFVCSLHHILHGCPQGVGDFAVAWFQSRVLSLAMTSVLKRLRAVAPQPGGTAYSDANLSVVRNAAALAQFAVNRLVSGLPAPPTASLRCAAAVMAELTAQRHLPDGAAQLAQMRAVAWDWALHMLSPGGHCWRRANMLRACEQLVACGNAVFSAPFSPEYMKRLLPRLVETTLGVIIDYDASQRPDARVVGEVWYKLYHTNRSAAALSGNALADPGRRVDLVHGGIDLLRGEMDPIGNFVGWFADRRFEFVDMFRKQYSKAFVRFEVCHPNRQRRWSAWAQAAGFTESVQQDVRGTDAVGGAMAAWERQLACATAVDMAHLAAPSEPFHRGVTVDRNAETDTATNWDAPSALLFAAPTAAAAPKLAGLPLSNLLSVFNSAAHPFSSDEPVSILRRLTPILRTSTYLDSAAVAIARRVMGTDDPLVYAANAYVMVDGEALIATLLMTAADLFVLTGSQLTDGKGLLVAPVGRHDAASKRQRTARAMVSNLVRRFVPSMRSGGGSVLADSAGTFRFSQYYRQLRADAARKDTAGGATPRVWRYSTAWITRASERNFQHQSAAVELTFESRQSLFVVALDTEFTMSKA
jgi:hypothetical protein